jgi:hypothetical protein
LTSHFGSTLESGIESTIAIQVTASVTAEIARAGRSGYLPAVTGLRFFLALWVIFGHIILRRLRGVGGAGESLYTVDGRETGRGRALR